MQSFIAQSINKGIKGVTCSLTSGPTWQAGDSALRQS